MANSDCDPHMNSGDTIQIEVPDFDPDIDDISPTTTDQESNNPVTQGLATPPPKSVEKVIECTTFAPSHQDICRAHQDGGNSQGGIEHSLPPARRWGGFNSNNKLNSSTKR